MDVSLTPLDSLKPLLQLYTVLEYNWAVEPVTITLVPSTLPSMMLAAEHRAKYHTVPAVTSAAHPQAATTKKGIQMIIENTQ